MRTLTTGRIHLAFVELVAVCFTANAFLIACRLDSKSGAGVGVGVGAGAGTDAMSACVGVFSSSISDCGELSDLEWVGVTARVSGGCSDFFPSVYPNSLSSMASRVNAGALGVGSEVLTSAADIANLADKTGLPA